MKTLHRIKGPGATLSEIDISKLNAFAISCSDEEGVYYLSAMNDAQEFVLATGTFDHCHSKLNAIHDKLGIKIIDL